MGRQDELAQLMRCLANPQHPLITIVGLGGIGKTQLALAAAHSHLQSSAATETTSLPAPDEQSFAETLYFISFAEITVTDHADTLLYEQLAATIGEAIDLSFSGQQSLQQQLYQALHNRSALLILDGYDEWAKVKPFLLQLLDAAPQLQLLITSPLALDLQIETTLYLRGLTVPSVQPPWLATDEPTATLEELLRFDAIALFARRATQIVPTFAINPGNMAHVVAICQMVDGSPLGIELALRLLVGYSCDQIAGKIAADYRSLVTTQFDVPYRHQRIYAMLDATWQRLTDMEAQLLVSLASFAAPFTHEAAAALISTAVTTTSTDLVAELAALRQKALLHYDEAQRLFTMPLLIRQYALQQQWAWPSAVAESSERHATYYLTLLQQHAQALHHDQAIVTQMKIAWPDIELAWQERIAARDFAQVAASAPGFAQLHRQLAQRLPAIERFEEVISALRAQLQEAPSRADEEALACLLAEIIPFYLDEGDEAQATAAANELLHHSTNLRDFTLRGIAYDALANAAQLREESVAVLSLGKLACDLFRMVDEPHRLANTLLTCGNGSLMAGEIAQAIATLHTSELALADPDLDLQIRREWLLARCYQYTHRPMAALHHLTTAVALGERFKGSSYLCFVKIQEAELWRSIGYFDRAKRLIEALAADTASYTPLMNASLYLQWGRILSVTDGPTAAYDQLMTALGIARRMKLRSVEKRICLSLGHLSLALGATIEAKLFYQQAYLIQEWTQIHQSMTDVYMGLANLAAATEDLAAAESYLTLALHRLDGSGEDATEEPFFVYQSAIEILRLLDDARADQLLQEAYERLHAQADLITDPAMRHAFLTNVPSNRWIVEAMQPRAA